jgi:acid phosphatase
MLLCRSAAMIASAILLLAISAFNWTLAAEVPLPRPDHVVLVIMENHSFADLMETDQAPFIHRLTDNGALFTKSFAVSHPSQPNYLALFSGSTHSVQDNNFHLFAAPTLASSLAAKGYSFVGYVERGSPRKHNPWQSFADSQHVEQDLSQFPNDFTKLPTVSFVIPNLDHDMHDGSIRRGDEWLRQRVNDYAEWCRNSNNLLILTFDESDSDSSNQILTVFFGGVVRTDRYSEKVDHYIVLRTLQAMYGLDPLGEAASREPIEDVWSQTQLD